MVYDGDQAREGEVRLRPLDQPDLVACGQFSGLQHSVVPPRATGFDHGFRQPVVVEAKRQLEAWLPRLTDLQQRAPDPMHVSDSDLLLIQAVDGQVFAKGAWNEEIGVLLVL